MDAMDGLPYTSQTLVSDFAPVICPSVRQRYMQRMYSRHTIQMLVSDFTCVICPSVRHRYVRAMYTTQDRVYVFGLSRMRLEVTQW